jgi:solute:Na+ symporter, SSS family
VFFTAVGLWEPTSTLPTEYRSLIVASATLGVWLVVTFSTRPEPMAHLVAFYRRIRPDGPGWRPVAAQAPDVRPDGTLGRGILCAVLGTTVVWLTLPGIGAVIFGEYGRAAACLGGAAIAAMLLFAAAPRAAATTQAVG